MWFAGCLWGCGPKIRRRSATSLAVEVSGRGLPEGRRLGRNKRTGRIVSNVRVLSALVLVVLSAGGCAVATKSSHIYENPEREESVANSEVFGLSMDACWQRLIAGLSSEFFVITNVEKASGLITLDFGTDHPEGYVDCGTTTRTYGDQSVVYEVAGDSQYMADVQVGVNVSRQTVQRDTSLSGKINVHVSEVAGGTRVAVNARYIWTAEIGGFYESVGSMGSAGPFPLNKQVHTKSFNTNAPSLGEGDEISCGSNGALEKLILDIVRAEPEL